MIITRSPLRLSIGGGGTDLASYYQERGGFLMAMAINKHVYISLQRTLDPGILLKYSQLERVDSIEQIQHPIVREAMLVAGIDAKNFEVTSVADIPAGTGLGSSGSFTTALLKALYKFKRRHISGSELAELACHIEIDRLGEPIGKQDQYIAAYGGLTCFTFDRSGEVHVEPAKVSDATLETLHHNMLLFYTGRTRSAGSILKEQNDRSKSADASMLANLDRVKELGYRTRDAFERDDLGTWGEIMHEHWEAKKKRSANMSNPQIDEWYELARNNGAIGGKLVGAGGGGFLLFYTTQPDRVRAAMARVPLEEVRVQIDLDGTRVLQ